MSMTREELAVEIEELLKDLCAEPRMSRAKCEILALFARYEAEQWSNTLEMPGGKGREVLVHDDRETNYHPSVELWWPGKRWSKHWRFRELPPGPTE